MRCFGVERGDGEASAIDGDAITKVDARKHGLRRDLELNAAGIIRAKVENLAHLLHDAGEEGSSRGPEGGERASDSGIAKERKGSEKRV